MFLIKFTRVFYLIFPLTLFLFSSCSKENMYNSIVKLDRFEQKEKIRLLKKEEKVKLWEERINKVLEKDVPDDYRKYLINLLSHNNLDVILSDKSVAIQWAEDAVNIFDQVDFYHIFCGFEDFNISNNAFSNQREICQSCIEAISKIKLNIVPRGNGDPVGPVNPNEKCKCDWGWCGQVDIDCKEIRCVETDTGCGFLLVFGCDAQCVL
jgi:hypothetical protein